MISIYNYKVASNEVSKQGKVIASSATHATQTIIKSLQLQGYTEPVSLTVWN